MKLKDQTKKESIRQATLNVVLSKGIAGVKMAAISKAVGLSVSTIHVYHKNKEELLISIYLQIFKERLAITIAKEGSKVPYKLRLKKKWLSSVKFNTEKFRELNFIEQMKQSPYYSMVLEKIRPDKHLFFESIIEEGKGQQIIKDAQNKILMGIYMSSVRQTSKLIMDGTISNKKKDMDLMFSFFWDSIKS